MLEIDGIEAFYGPSQVLFGVSLAIAAGEVATLIGRNGMGKTSTVRAVMGLLPVRRGRVSLEGRTIERLPPYRIAQLGLGLVPEGRQIFPNLTVRENLLATARGGGPWSLERIQALFPRLAQRRDAMGNQLSGGEQQMLAIGRALMLNPRLLILDEATEGLAPLIRAEIWSCLQRLKAEGQAILLIDKNVETLARIADRHFIMEKGRIVWQGGSAALIADRALQMRHLGV